VISAGRSDAERENAGSRSGDSEFQSVGGWVHGGCSGRAGLSSRPGVSPAGGRFGTKTSPRVPTSTARDPASSRQFELFLDTARIEPDRMPWVLEYSRTRFPTAIPESRP
jgi:hypothetical protein